MTSNHHWDIFTQLGPFQCHCIALSNVERNMREISMRKYPQGLYKERSWKYPQRKFSFISREFLEGYYEEISPGISL